MTPIAPETTPTTLTIRLGCEIQYFTNRPTHAVMSIRPAEVPYQRIESEIYRYEPWQRPCEHIDSHGNRVDRVTLPPGVTVIRHDAMVEVPALPEAGLVSQEQVPAAELPMEILRYTLPSRYCDSDRLTDFARDHFDRCEPGAGTVRAICDWVHRNLEYRFGWGSRYTTASDALAQGYGVCRDFAHLVAALCRTFNIPARYATCHLSDIGGQPTGTPMDFHACVQVYLGDRWYTVDARFNEQRIGRVPIAIGMDASETALSTFFGGVDLMRFDVWNYQVDPAQVTLRDPLDYSLRLDTGGPLKLRA